MTREAQEAREASSSSPLRAEGRLTEEGDRAVARSPAHPLSLRLKRSVQVFPATDGSLYLMRLGAGDDMVIEAPRDRDRALLAALAQGFHPLPELEAALDVRSGELDEDLALLTEAGVVETQVGRSRLSPQERERYDRQLIYLADLDGNRTEELQLRLRRSTVALIGCGGLGSWVASALSGAGVGHLVLVDDDRVELSNLNRQLLFSEAQVGQRKVDAAATSLRAHNSGARVTGIDRRIRRAADLDDILDQGIDFVVATADWPPHHLPRWVNEACLERSVPWIGAGQFPPRLRIGPLVVPGESSCLECLERATRRGYPLYDEIAAWRARAWTPDSSVGFVSGAIGCLLASEVVHFLVGAFPPRSVGAVLLLDLATMDLSREEIPPDPGCPRCRGAAVSVVGRC